MISGRNVSVVVTCQSGTDQVISSSLHAMRFAIAAVALLAWRDDPTVKET